jgi:hypothetical protein
MDGADILNRIKEESGSNNVGELIDIVDRNDGNIPIFMREKLWNNSAKVKAIQDKYRDTVTIEINYDCEIRYTRCCSSDLQYRIALKAARKELHRLLGDVKNNTGNQKNNK